MYVCGGLKGYMMCGVNLNPPAWDTRSFSPGGEGNWSVRAGKGGYKGVVLWGGRRGDI